MNRDRDYELREIVRCREIMQSALHPIFVFGSNLAGRHGGGAAHVAHQDYGAVWGVGEGLTGKSYALPTKDRHLHTLPIEDIAAYIATFLDVAFSHPETAFAVTRVGCGLAGFTDDEIEPFFVDAPDNCHLPEGWCV